MAFGGVHENFFPSLPTVRLHERARAWRGEMTFRGPEGFFVRGAAAVRFGYDGCGRGEKCAAGEMRGLRAFLRDAGTRRRVNCDSRDFALGGGIFLLGVGFREVDGAE